jgi:peptidyl-prolyl cis-trans isomerase C
MKKLSVLFITVMISNLTIAQTNDKVVAEVNGSKIMLSELEKTFQQTLMFVSNRKVTKESVLQDLINRELGIQRAKKEKIDSDPVVKAKLDDILYHAQISKDLEKQLNTIQVSDKEVQDYYAKNKEYRTSHILFRLRATPDVAEVKKGLEQSLEVYNEAMKTPDKFEEMATNLSQTNVAQIGGDLGYQPPTRYAPEYFEAINGKNVGFISKPVRTQYGFHVIKILGVKDFDKIDKNLYKKIIYDIKRDKMIADYHQNLAKNAKVNVNSNLLK